MDGERSQYVSIRNSIILEEVCDLDVDDERFVDIEDDNVDSQTKSNSCTKSSNKKLTSEAWEFFDRVEVNGAIKAECKHCLAILSVG